MNSLTKGLLAAYVCQSGTDMPFALRCTGSLPRKGFCRKRSLYMPLCLRTTAPLRCKGLIFPFSARQHSPGTKLTMCSSFILDTLIDFNARLPCLFHSSFGNVGGAPGAGGSVPTPLSSGVVYFGRGDFGQGAGCIFLVYFLYFPCLRPSGFHSDLNTFSMVSALLDTFLMTGSYWTLGPFTRYVDSYF